MSRPQRIPPSPGWAAEYGGPVAMKLAIVVRADLEMGRGKIAAQVAHAAVAATLASFGGGAFHSWLADGQPKVGLKAPTGEPLTDVTPRAPAPRLPVPPPPSTPPTPCRPH